MNLCSTGSSNKTAAVLTGRSHSAVYQRMKRQTFNQLPLYVRVRVQTWTYKESIKTNAGGMGEGEKNRSGKQSVCLFAK